MASRWHLRLRTESALAAAFDELLGTKSQTGLLVALRDYPDVFQTAFAGRVVRRPEVAEARLKIYGPLEARLTQSDRLIIGGLVEGVWPPAPRVDPWLSRPMRHELGLDLPERRIGLLGTRFRPIARRRGDHPQPLRQSGRRTRRGLALSAPAGGGRRRAALASRETRRRKSTCTSQRNWIGPTKSNPFRSPHPSRRARRGP